jgi:putative ABC transport system ATP-binding protein
MKKAIEVRNLVKTYGAGETSVHALKRVDLDVNEGELLLLLGRERFGQNDFDFDCRLHSVSYFRAAV